jgi:hypothetical protein
MMERHEDPSGALGLLHWFVGAMLLWYLTKDLPLPAWLGVIVGLAYFCTLPWVMDRVSHYYRDD